MLYNQLFDNHTFNVEKAISYGFTNIEGIYCYRKSLKQSDFYVEVQISQDRFQVEVFEQALNEIYLPFNVKDSVGGFVSTIRENVEEIIQEILKYCFENSNVREILLSYVKEKYGTEPETPWDKFKEYYTLKTENKQKWFGIIMLLPYRTIGVEKEGKIHVINVKARPEDIQKLIDGIHYFPAYHMNKKYWISILLDKNIEIMQVKKLIDESYVIVEG